VGLLVAVLAGGTAGYMMIERWNAWDAFYMTVITITTVGFREVHDLSRTGQVFTVILLIAGVGTALYTFTFLVAQIVEGGLQGRLQRRRQAHMIDTLRDHFIVCGYGRIGRIVASEFRRERVPFVVIERDAERVKAATDEGVLAIEGDASREEVLNRVGIGAARGLIAVVGSDAENVYAVMSARGMRPDLFIISRAAADDATVKLKRAGADRVVSPYQLGGARIAQTALRPAVVDFVEIATSAEHLELTMEEIAVQAESSFTNRTLVDANLRQRFGIIVVGIQRSDGRMEFNPEPDTMIRAGDRLVVLGRYDALRRLEVEVAR
jgi:voltage-gated potassium channel